MEMTTIPLSNSSLLNNVVKHKKQMHTTVREYICDYNDLGSLLSYRKDKEKTYSRSEKFLLRIKLPLPERDVITTMFVNNFADIALSKQK
jgi:hypothetical protein